MFFIVFLSVTSVQLITAPVVHADGVSVAFNLIEDFLFGVAKSVSIPKMGLIGTGILGPEWEAKNKILLQGILNGSTAEAMVAKSKLEALNKKISASQTAGSDYALTNTDISDVSYFIQQSVNKIQDNIGSMAYVPSSSLDATYPVDQPFNNSATLNTVNARNKPYSVTWNTYLGWSSKNAFDPSSVSPSWVNIYYQPCKITRITYTKPSADGLSFNNFTAYRAEYVGQIKYYELTVNSNAVDFPPSSQYYISYNNASSWAGITSYGNHPYPFSSYSGSSSYGFYFSDMELIGNGSYIYTPTLSPKITSVDIPSGINIPKDWKVGNPVVLPTTGTGSVSVPLDVPIPTTGDNTGTGTTTVDTPSTSWWDTHVGNIINSIQAIPTSIINFFTVDWSAVTASMDYGPVWQKHFKPFYDITNALTNISVNPQNSGGKFYMIIPKEMGGDGVTLVCVLDYTIGGTYISWARIFLTWAIWLAFGWWILEQFKPRLDIN